MSEPSRVTVYSFRLCGAHVVSPHVPDDAVDDSGCYRRINTGWGVLA